MRYLLRNANVYTNNTFSKLDLLIEGGIISTLEQSISADTDCYVFDFSSKVIFPGFADVHVHLREPGFSYKETIRTGTLAAARSGYTTLCTMPNLDPVPDSIANLEVQLQKIRSDAVVPVYPYGAITVDEKGRQVTDFEDMAGKVIAFSDDGKGVQSSSVMLEAMKKAKGLGKIIAAHCEDDRWEIPSEREWRQLERDLELVKKTGCAYHVCHVSTKESVDLIRRAKKEGLDISCETAPHYLLLHDMLRRDDGRFKMNPPIGSYDDMISLVEGIRDGTIDMIATDHAPHSEEEKSGGFRESLNGITGLECAFPVLYTGLVKQGKMALETLIETMSLAPKKRFGLPGSDGIRVGARADLAVFDLDAEYEIDSRRFLSMGKSTPFDGYKVNGKCLFTMVEGRIVWEDQENA